MTLQELMTRWNGYQIENAPLVPPAPRRKHEGSPHCRTHPRRARPRRHPVASLRPRHGHASPASRRSARPHDPSSRRHRRALRQRGRPDFLYASEVPGVMHACGHDCHISMLLTAAMIVNEIRDRLKGTIVRLPARRGVGSGRARHDRGRRARGRRRLLRHARLVRLSRRHRSRCAKGADDGLGRSVQDPRPRQVHSHGAQPQLGADALIMGAAIAQNLQTIVSPRDLSRRHRRRDGRQSSTRAPASTSLRAPPNSRARPAPSAPPCATASREQITRIARSTAEAMRHGRCRIPRIVPRHGQ